MTRARLWTLCIPLFATLACDIVVEGGQTTVLGNRGSVFAEKTPNAVTVRPGGTLVVEDADVFGRGQVLELRAQQAAQPGAGIVSDGGIVRVLAGTLSGGNVVFVESDPNAPALPPGPPTFFGDTLAPALIASRSTVEIDGGTFVSSGTFGSLGRRFPRVSATVSISDGQLQIRGGTFRPGPRDDGFRIVTSPLRVERSSVEISGGSFDAGPVQLAFSQSRIRGGHFTGGLSISGALRDLPPPFPATPPAGCTEISGGTFSPGGPSRVSDAAARGLVFVSGMNERLFFLGTGFNLPLGAVAVPPPIQITVPVPNPGRPSSTVVIEQPVPVSLTGILADGSPLDITLLVDDGEVVLAAPGDAGCDR
jgi:hypothetical protein